MEETQMTEREQAVVLLVNDARERAQQASEEGSLAERSVLLTPFTDADGSRLVLLAVVRGEAVEAIAAMDPLNALRVGHHIIGEAVVSIEAVARVTDAILADYHRAMDAVQGEPPEEAGA